MYGIDITNGHDLFNKRQRAIAEQKSAIKEVEDLLSILPDGMDMLTGRTLAVSLSAGQVQRLRVILKMYRQSIGPASKL